MTHMGPLGSPRQSWKEYKIGDMSGKELIERIRHERLWISLHDINKADPGYQRLLDSIYEEIHARVPGHPRTFQRTCAVLISSPGAQVYYHFDTSGQTLWQIQGTKKVRIYPTLAPFLTQSGSIWLRRFVRASMTKQRNLTGRGSTNMPPISAGTAI